MQTFKLQLSAIALSALALAGCNQEKTTAQPAEADKTTQDNTKQPKTIAISAIVEHPSLDDIRRGIVSGLADLGYKDGQNLTVNFQSAQGNMATASQIAKQFASENPDAIVAISTPTAQSLAAATQTIPLVYTAVSDPVAAKLIDNNNVATQANITGLSSQLPLEPQIELFTKVKPDAKRIGYVYSPGEANSVALKDQLIKILPKYGMSLVDIPANRSADVASATRALDGRADLIYTSLDNNVASAMEAMVQVANELDLPIIASDEFSVRRGATAALGVNDFDFGVTTAKLVAGILDGKNPADITPEVMNTLTLYISPKHAVDQGVTLTDEVKKDAIDVDATPRSH
ncbi:ABC transporter substrate-binding protein [Moraxella bovoculi]|uniref:ABC transporter substrate-binding protein n=1 Tax=Moraxella bovoculi TaxID=386891 RepID=UPI001571093F|nr:ABC transporter substrate-binding protein [Moraxella bovoculi]NSM10959.1 ABC transporter substrate-binding protein [Moraxella bovoculi]